MGIKGFFMNLNIQLKGVLGFVTLIIIILSICGWVMNIIEIIHMKSLTGLMIVKCIGIFVAPLGAILGWL